MKDEVSSSQSKSQYIAGSTCQKEEKVKRSKGQKVKRSPWLCSWRDILASFLIMLSPALMMRSGCFHTITESPAIYTLFYIIIISYHVIIISIIILQCKKHFFIVSLAIIAPWGFFCLCRICRICTLGTWKILPIAIRLWKDLTY